MNVVWGAPLTQATRHSTLLRSHGMRQTVRRKAQRASSERPTEIAPLPHTLSSTPASRASHPRAQHSTGRAMRHGLLGTWASKLPRRAATSAEARERESDILAHRTQLRTLANWIVGPAVAEQPTDRSVQPRRPRSGWHFSCGRTHIVTSWPCPVGIRSDEPGARGRQIGLFSRVRTSVLVWRAQRAPHRVKAAATSSGRCSQTTASSRSRRVVRRAGRPVSVRPARGQSRRSAAAISAGA